MAGERALTKFQWGLESTRGTAVAATRKVGATPKAIPTDRVWEQVRLATGQRAAVNAKRNDELLVRDTLSFDNAYFQALPGLFQCALDGAISPAEVNVGQGDYKWDVAPSLTAANAPKSLTIEMGDDTQGYEVEFCQFERLVISGEMGQDGGASPVKIDADYYGRQVTPTTFTNSLALPTGLEFINAKLARLYLDTSWAGIGGTEKTGLLRGFSLEFLTGLHPKFMGSANKYFTTYGEGDLAVMLTLTLEGNSDADAIFDLYQAGTERALRLDMLGSQIGSGGVYTFRTDLYGYFEQVVPLSSEVNGNNLHQALFVMMPDSSGNFLDIDIITNDDEI